MAVIFIKHDCPLGDNAVQRDKDSDRGSVLLTKLSFAKIVYR